MKQHLRFFTLALLCAMCSVGWGQSETKVYKFTFPDANSIPHGNTNKKFFKNELPITLSLPTTNTELGNINWKFYAETKAESFQSISNSMYGWTIGNTANPVDSLKLKSLVNFINVKKVTVVSRVANKKGDSFIKVGNQKSDTHSYSTAKNETLTKEVFVWPKAI